MMKKIVYLLAALMVSVAVVGCGAHSAKEGADVDKTEKNVKNIELSAIKDSVKEALGEDYLTDMEYDDVFIKETLGLEKDSYEDIIAEGRKVGFFVDTFIAVKAKDGKTVEEKLNAYRDSLINNSMVYPTNAVQLQTSKVVRHGNYVFYFCLGEIPKDVVSEGDDAILELAKEKNERAKKAIDSCFE